MNIQQNERQLSLIGMANVGKSRWSQGLAEQLGYECICCDDNIAERLKPELKSTGFTGDTVDITDVAEWMGMPFEESSAARQSSYLEAEELILRYALTRLSLSYKAGVIDTTGSVIYLTDQVLTLLRHFTTVVYLETPPAMVEYMLQQFIECPKPVIWGASYAPNPGEDPMKTVRRCYPALLKTRAARYAELARVTIPWEVHRSTGFTVKNLLEEVERQLSTTLAH